jgi:hypothetical protein
MSKVYGDRARRRYIEILTPSGGKEWMNYIHPTESSTSINILDKLHESMYEIFTEETSTSITDILQENYASITKIHDKFVL